VLYQHDNYGCSDRGGDNLALIDFDDTAYSWYHQRPEHDEPRNLRELKDTISAECEKFDPDSAV
jgi:hypothetical protein